MNNFSPEISGDFNIHDLSSYIPKTINNSYTPTFEDSPKSGDKNNIPITFNSSTTNIRNTSLNEKALNDLLQVMQSDPKLNLLILGNVVFSHPMQNNEETIINGSVGTVGDLKLGRARAVESF